MTVIIRLNLQLFLYKTCQRIQHSLLSYLYPFHKLWIWVYKFTYQILVYQQEIDTNQCQDIQEIEVKLLIRMTDLSLSN